jgi:hypothetical protein
MPRRAVLQVEEFNAEFARVYLQLLNLPGGRIDRDGHAAETPARCESASSDPWLQA